MKFKHRREIERIRFLEANKESIKKIYQIIPRDFSVDRILFILIHDSYLFNNYPSRNSNRSQYFYRKDIAEIFSPVLSRKNWLNICFNIYKLSNGDTRIIVHFFNPIIRDCIVDFDNIGSDNVTLIK